MSDEFIIRIKELFNMLQKPEKNISTRSAIDEYKGSLGISNGDRLSDYYIKVKKDRKEKGVVYTPVHISRFMISNTIKEEDIISNPFIKILDPACGSGGIIIECFIYLSELYKKVLQKVNQNNNLQLTYGNIDQHIIDNNLFGIDIDVTALNILQIDLFCITGYINRKNFVQSDFLLDNPDVGFDIIVGNPPYIGHKSLDSMYSNKIREVYGHILKDKGDLSFCFLSKSIDEAPPEGKITFITSRYFLESLSGKEIRRFLLKNSYIDKIVDFYGIRPFNGVGIDPVILFLKKSCCEYIEVFKPDKADGLVKGSFLEHINCGSKEGIKRIRIKKSELDDKPWMLIGSLERSIVNKIHEKCCHTLEDLCYSYQGIITGCDKAFIVNDKIIINEKLERDIVKPWIKSSYINKNSVTREGSYIIYSDLIYSDQEYPNSLRYIARYKEKLMNRMECRRGTRKWYKLQWGRNRDIFEGEKIIFPYKADNNRFAFDKGSYFSADIYALVIKDINLIKYDFLLFMLNTELYEFYFKTFAKKLGGNLYEYYPNNVMKLKLPHTLPKACWNEESLYRFFEFSNAEIDIIKKKGNQ